MNANSAMPDTVVNAREPLVETKLKQTSQFQSICQSSHGRSLCRIGVFYDGNFFSYAQNFFYHNRGLGWLKFSNLHSLLEEYLSELEPGFSQYRVVYGGWFQGLYQSNQASYEQLRKDRNLQHDLMHAGIESHFIPMAQCNGREKGVDVALTLQAMQIGLENQIDVAVLVTGDGDFVPLAQMLMKYGVRSLAAYFDYTDERVKKRSFINERLLKAVNYAVNLNVLENSEEWQEAFYSLFRKTSEGSSSRPSFSEAIAPLNCDESSLSPIS